MLGVGSMESLLLERSWLHMASLDKCLSLSLSVLTAIFQVNLGYPVFIEAKDDGSGARYEPSRSAPSGDG